MFKRLQGSCFLTILGGKKKANRIVRQSRKIYEPVLGSTMRTVALIPAYNEENEIGKVVNIARDLVDQVIVIDDGSTDGTSEEASVAGATVVRLERNRGKGYALRVGFRKALEINADFIVTLDADSEHNPETIPRLLEKMQEKDLDILICSRKRARSIRRKLLNEFTNFWVNMATGYRLNDTQCGYRVFKAEALRRLKLRANKFAIELETILEASKLGLMLWEVGIETEEFRRSKLTEEDMLRINLFFDRWILRNVATLELPFYKKVFLQFFAYVGKLLTEKMRSSSI